MIFLNERWCTIRWDESIYAVVAEWRAYFEGEEFRASTSVVIDALRRKRTSRYLSDSRLLGPVSQADQRWTHAYWFPQAVDAGMRTMAIVSPKASVARLSLRQIMSKVNDISIVTGHFDDVDAARNWLRSEAPH